MDIVFNCPNCDQEMAVDQTGAGSQIECPSCGETITIPATGKVTTGSLPTAPTPAASSIHSSAAAKVEMHLKVSVRDKPSAPLISKTNQPQGNRPKGEKQIRIRTIRRSACIESGQDHFDERVSDFLHSVGEADIISTHAVSYEFFDVGVQKVMTDYGLLVVYRG